MLQKTCWVASDNVQARQNCTRNGTHVWTFRDISQQSYCCWLIPSRP